MSNTSTEADDTAMTGSKGVREGIRRVLANEMTSDSEHDKDKFASDQIDTFLASMTEKDGGMKSLEILKEKIRQHELRMSAMNVIQFDETVFEKIQSDMNTSMISLVQKHIYDLVVHGKSAKDISQLSTVSVEVKKRYESCVYICT